MSIDKFNNEVCEACGSAGEIGFIIKEGDDVSEVTIYSNDPSQLKVELDKYLVLAKEVCAKVEYEISDITDESKEAVVRFQFEVSAEKLIFELKTRSLRR
ncbi:DUF406 family protein [Vibrio genomosp. F10]|uniref:DUF406 domain-containing protein n=1 Tax=Vibrio genomosp. F10 str. ZF-129 TaxID=1187848 RepID=A0A1E5BJ01_9VIBR|nr:DUF406 family protein [Vibrio genomosp. F10]OEE37475.1 hypothetical protein A1QO_17205 [Vibrio genomosp. F10 str. ZF-129]OEE93048.1 hypothetical protein A1QM_10580 [Vibrio genomosp. F10 str. 9ZC157]OEE93375.1 hypothetical protein A1QK_02920 [Vibrio genomosp. F10 str. 9ZD137]OEF07500.1 hypothetical protein A1QI_17270 [Vibrio genomosp. F10 str. 9ZB36]